MRRHLDRSAVLLLGVLTIFACARSPEAFGTLEGHVTIGPLLPVVREGESEPRPAPDVYEAREIVVFEEDGKSEYIRVEIDANGNYRADLPVGIYVVDINRIGIDSAADLPKKIEIIAQAVTRLDIDIDTGIR
ncbi:MAG: hypothetical protein GTO63_13755 [Anaerolineae bacterium]|nr:hypothetical protein [Anaerolineae bacterium]NIN95909.1 hypothetical protein [Anaerolineae bacterium]